MHSRLPFSNVLPREAGNDLTEFMKFGAFKGNLLEAVPDWVPCRTAVHQCTQVPVPVGSHCCSRNQEFGAWAGQRTAWEFMPRQLLSSFNDLSKVSQGRKGFVGIPMIVASATGTLMSALSMLDNVRRVRSAEASFLVTFGCAISEACGKKLRNIAVLPALPSEKVWFITFNLHPSGSHMLKSPMMIPKPSGWRGQ